MTAPRRAARLAEIATAEDLGGAARALAAFRILLASAALWQAFMILRDLPQFVGEYGLMQRPINAAVAPEALPSLSWFRGVWESGLASERAVAYAVLAVYAIALFYLAAGIGTRAAAAVALFLHLLLKASGSASAYGAHELATNGLFFCMLLPVGSCWTLAARPPAWSAAGVRTARIVLRVYLAIVYVSSGVQKIAGAPWRNGEAMWSFLMRPEVTVAGFGWLSRVPWLTAAAAWFVLAVEIGYAVCLFVPRARLPWLLATTALHLGIAVTLHLWFFSLTMIALNVGALATVRDKHSSP